MKDALARAGGYAELQPVARARVPVVKLIDTLAYAASRNAYGELDGAHAGGGGEPISADVTLNNEVRRRRRDRGGGAAAAVDGDGR